jgi:hypothetical protein
MVGAFPTIGQHPVWLVGEKQKVRVGVNARVGGQGQHRMLKDLVVSLHDKEIYLLQALYKGTQEGDVELRLANK